ncbi:MAG TPA: lytic murein transglycosylase [Gaiellaceae bacterium]|nr:lytic murein transglycosylase [Gaiellaceae bacterium]
MKRILLAAALALAVTAGAARGDVFAVAQPLALPSAETPNTPGSLLLPAAWTQRAIAPRTVSHEQLEALWHGAGGAYGIPWQVLASINKIESNFGRNMGPSSAGAVGWMQFMPDTWLRWGMDANGDRVSDPWDPEDAVYAAARYLAAAGARDDLRRGIFAYNHANWYVNDVLELAETFGAGGVETAFTYDRLGEDLHAAEALVVEVNEALVVALKAQKRTARVEQALIATVDENELLSDRLAAQKRATLAGVQHARASGVVAELRERLEEAQAALSEARLAAQGASFGAAAGTLLAAPSYSGEYVFPVGGGASVVSVAATHHDYPAADIAAPHGAPLYALANAVVLRAWSAPDPRCGIGFTMRTGDGQVWTYCHLAYLEPSVTDGATLTAGAPVGLVGSTGHSTGPHLHLQLRPATAYPQSQPWFQSFAGTAFRWQGAPAPLAAPIVQRETDVFAAPEGDDVVLFSR